MSVSIGSFDADDQRVLEMREKDQRGVTVYFPPSYTQTSLHLIAFLWAEVCTDSV